MAIKSFGTPHKKSQKRYTIPFVIVVVLSILAVALYYYQTTRPERLFREALVESFSDKNQSRTVTLQIEDTKQRFNANIKIKSVNMFGSFESPATVDITLFKQTLQLPATVRYVEGQYYLKMQDAGQQLNAIRTGSSQLAPYVDYLEDVITPLQQNWVLVDEFPDDSISTECRKEISKIGTTEQSTATVEEAARNSRLLESVTVVTRGQQEYTYSLVLNASRISSFTEQISSESSGAGLTSTCKNAIIESFKGAAASGKQADTFNLEVSINKNTKLITKIISRDADTIRTVTYSNFGRAIKGATTAKPTDAQNLSDVLKQIPFLQ